MLLDVVTQVRDCIRVPMAQADSNDAQYLRMRTTSRDHVFETAR
jgi:hypothetical protein